MDYQIQGGNKVTLKDRDFIAQGGEASLYAKGNQVFKIYTDPKAMIPPTKIQELACLDRSNIIRPQAVLLDQRQNPVGFSMQRIKQNVALARLFTNDYQRKQGLDTQHIIALLEQMQATIAFIHSQQCLLVDGNEMNYLVDSKSHKKVYFIDVDSWQTPSFPATAILPTIRDYHSSQFSPLTDWFAFAVISCQLFLGIHPYKGRHPDFKKHDLSGRMQNNVSIFNSEVSLPAAVRDFSLIPTPWHDWLRAVLEQGQRSAPPSAGVPAASSMRPVVRPKTVHGSNNFIITRLAEYDSPIRAVYGRNGQRVVVTADKLYLENAAHALPHPAARLIVTPQNLTPVFAWVEQQQLKLLNAHTQDMLNISLQAAQVLVEDNQLFVIYQERCTAIRFHELGGKCLAAPGASWQIMPHATQVLDGLLYQNILGQPWLLLPWKSQSCAVLAVPELRDYRIMSGRYSQGIAMLTAYRQGRYDRFCFWFNPDHSQYQLEKTENIEADSHHFICLPSGVALHLVEDGVLSLFHREQSLSKQILDPVLTTKMQLANNGSMVLFSTENVLYQLKMQ
ncbi:serine/threonine protein kinase [Candidatus Venteria ishoeyi]|uniref:Protein kinase domain-containing protein n=1 Tax=Candidatus Venteria ishoeyi TaxID=1899563 RepID=A0A1H6FI32_9GAMM|nr:serine/threonine protein kinase [Candidatus Venteria ishoeyi]SEH08674.1 Uncharacterised protein [Candidatus Venteria ishoeyi]